MGGIVFMIGLPTGWNLDTKSHLAQSQRLFGPVVVMAPKGPTCQSF